MFVPYEPPWHASCVDAYRLLKTARAVGLPLVSVVCDFSKLIPGMRYSEHQTNVHWGIDTESDRCFQLRLQRYKIKNDVFP